MVRKDVSKSRYIMILLVVVIVLLISLFIQFIDEKNKVGYFAQEIRIDEISYQDLITQRHYIEYLLDSNDTSYCDDIESSYEFSIQNLYELSDKLTSYLNEPDFVWDEYSYLRKKLINYQLEYWLMSKKIDEVCGVDYETVLYFFSNANTCYNCQNEAIILNHLRMISDNKLLIFALDATFDGTISLLVDRFGVTEDEVTIVIDDTPYKYKTIEELKEIICSNNDMINFCQNETVVE